MLVLIPCEEPVCYIDPKDHYREIPVASSFTDHELATQYADFYEKDITTDRWYRLYEAKLRALKSK